MADRDHLIAWPDANSQQRQVQSRGTVRNSAGVLSTRKAGEFLLKCGYFWPLGNPSREDHPLNR
jgi:hypothetical protein